MQASANAMDLLHPLQFSEDNLSQAQGILQTKAQMCGVSPQLQREFIINTPQHKWIAELDITLYQGDLNELLRTIKQQSTINNEISQRPMLALDLETTGLNNAIKYHKGEIVAFNDIVAVCIATNAQKGYYLPLKHNTLDNIKNYDKSEIKAFLQSILDIFHTIYHNAQFDLAVLKNQGLNIHNAEFSDTLLLAKLRGIHKYVTQTLSLKHLAKTLLKREMLELESVTQTMDMQTIPAKNAYIYGACDAINTYAIFEYLTHNEYSPYKSQPHATKIAHEAIISTITTYSFGLPINYDLAERTAQTIIRRMIICENVFKTQCNDLDIGSTQQIGTHILHILAKELLPRYNNDLNATYNAIDRLYFIQARTNGSKVYATINKDNLARIKDNILQDSTISKESQRTLYIISSVLLVYNSLKQRISIVLAMLKDSFNDEFGICRCPINVRLAGADTFRFTNASAKSKSAFDSIDFTHRTPKFVRGAGVSSFNSQGISSDKSTMQVLKCIGEDFINEIKRDDSTMETMIKDRLLEMLK